MGLTEAIHALIDGKGSAIVSEIGNRFTAAELDPKKLGGQAAVINDGGMMRAERRGAWRVVNN